MRRSYLVAAAALVTGLTAGAATATTYVPVADAVLFDRSAVVVEARVAAVEAVPGRELPAVDYLVDVEELFKGFVPGSSLIVRVPGGVRADGVGLWLQGVPRFAEGARALLFLAPRRDGTFALHQLALGAFHVAGAGTAKGAGIAYRDLGEALELASAGKARPADGVRDLAAFRAWLRDRAAGRERPADYFLPGTEPPAPKYASKYASKYALVTSSREPAPLGCGDSGGHAVRWFEFDAVSPVPWRFHVHPRTGMVSGGRADFQHALEAWNADPHTSVQYLYLGQTMLTPGFTRQDGVNTMVFEDPNDEIGGSFETGGVLALGGSWFLCDVVERGGVAFHPIVEAEIITQDGAHAFFEALADPSPAARELFAHELGHTLGLAHAPRRDALMHAAIHNDGRGAAFHVDDLAAAYFLYGAAGAPALVRPARPSGLTAVVEDLTTVELAWTDESDDESHFLIERRRAGELGFRTVATVPAGEVRHVDAVEPDTTYTYRVQAQNAAGRSGPSKMARVETPEDRRPPPPSNLWAAAVSQFRVRLTWRDNADDENGTLIEIRRQNTFVELPFVVPPGVNAVELLGITPGLPFTFRVRARNDFGVSAASNAATTTTFPPGTPCRSEPERLCLAGGRLTAEARYRLPGDDEERVATIVPTTDGSAFVWFFQPGNVEILLRFVEEGGTARVEASGLTDLEYRIVVTDTKSGESREIRHPAGAPCDPPPAVLELAASPVPRGRAVPNSGALAFAAASTDGGTAACEASEELLCLHDGRFSVELRWTIDGAPSRSGLAATSAGGTGFFSFDDPSRPDVVFKLLDGRSVNGRFWAFASAAPSPVDYEIRVADSATGIERTYRQPAGSRCAVADLGAFSDAP